MNMMAHPIHVRSHLDFHLDDVPKYWFGGDAYATRFFDSIAMLFPVGERFLSVAFAHSATRLQIPF